jgi:hypothetical protein
MIVTFNDGFQKVNRADTSFSGLTSGNDFGNPRSVRKSMTPIHANFFNLTHMLSPSSRNTAPDDLEQVFVSAASSKRN